MIRSVKIKPPISNPNLNTVRRVFVNLLTWVILCFWVVLLVPISPRAEARPNLQQQLKFQRRFQTIKRQDQRRIQQQLRRHRIQQQRQGEQVLESVQQQQELLQMRLEQQPRDQFQRQQRQLKQDLENES